MRVGDRNAQSATKSAPQLLDGAPARLARETCVGARANGIQRLATPLKGREAVPLDDPP